MHECGSFSSPAQQPQSHIVALPAIRRRLVQLAFGPLVMRHLNRLRLVARQLDGAAHVAGDRTAEAALAQQRVNRLDVVPA